MQILIFKIDIFKCSFSIEIYIEEIDENKKVIMCDRF